MEWRGKIHSYKMRKQSIKPKGLMIGQYGTNVHSGSSFSIFLSQDAILTLRNNGLLMTPTLPQPLSEVP